MVNATSRLFVMGLLAVLPVRAGEKAVPDLVVYVEESNLVTASVLLQAEATATRMFAGIGVKVRWTTRRPAAAACPSRLPIEIGVRMAAKKTASASSEAFASAYPYCG